MKNKNYVVGISILIIVIIVGFIIYANYTEFNENCKECKEDFISWCENCSSQNWPSSIEPYLPNIYDCMKKCFNTDLPKTVYCNEYKQLCTDFGVV